MKSNRRLVVIPAAAIAIFAVLFGAYYPAAQIASIQETDSIVAAETFDVTPNTTTIDVVEFNASRESSIVAPVTTNIESEPEIAEFILPFLNDAYAVTATQSSVTNQEWTGLPTGTWTLDLDTPNNVIWFSGHGTNKIIRLNLTSGVLTQWPAITGNDVSAISLDSTGKVWFGMSTFQKIGQLDPVTNSIVEWWLPDCCGAEYLTQVEYDAVSGHAVYMRTVPVGGGFESRIGKLNPSTGQTTEWTNLCHSQYCAERFGLDPGNGDIWWGDGQNNQIKRIRPSTPTTMTWWWIPQPGANPIGVSVEPSGVVYMAQQQGNRIMELDTTSNPNTITQWLIPTANPNPFFVAVNPNDGAVYFTEYSTNKLGRIVPSSNLFTEWTLVGSGLRPTWITIDPSTNDIYYSFENSGKIGRFS